MSGGPIVFLAASANHNTKSNPNHILTGTGR